MFGFSMLSSMIFEYETEILIYNCCNLECIKLLDNDEHSLGNIPVGVEVLLRKCPCIANLAQYFVLLVYNTVFIKRKWYV